MVNSVYRRFAEFPLDSTETGLKDQQVSQSGNPVRGHPQNHRRQKQREPALGGRRDNPPWYLPHTQELSDSASGQEERLSQACPTPYPHDRDDL